jgi:hypothetical protein
MTGKDDPHPVEMSITQAAAVLSRTLLREVLDDGRLPLYRHHKRLFVLRSDVLKLRREIEMPNYSILTEK